MLEWGLFGMDIREVIAAGGGGMRFVLDKVQIKVLVIVDGEGMLFYFVLGSLFFQNLYGEDRRGFEGDSEYLSLSRNRGQGVCWGFRGWGFRDFRDFLGVESRC